MRKSLSMLLVLVLYTVLALAQRKEVTGKVTDASGNPVSGVSIKVKGSNVGTSADANGVFKISVAPNSTLIISGVGFETQDVNVGDQSDVSVSLKQNNSALSEVVVTALGISRNRKAVNYSTQTIQAESIASAGKPNLVDDLNGKVSGVQITNAGGQVGSGSTIVIRGYNSLTGANQPLYVVDGVPIDNTSDESVSNQYNTPTANRGIDIDPSTVESVTVLKGGAATALYGSQANNGAILITTKKGKSGKVNIEGGYGYTFSDPNKFLDVQTAGYMKGGAGAGHPGGGVWNNATSNNWGPLASTNPVFPAGTMIDLTGSGTVDEGGNPIPYYANNYKNFYHEGHANRYNIQLSGGGDKTTFLIGASRTAQDGIITNNTYDKNSFLLNVVTQLTPRLKIGAKINYINTGGFRFDQGTLTNGLDYYVNTWDVRTFPWKAADGSETWWQPSIQDPNWTVHETGENYRINRYITSVDLDFKVANEWTLDYRVGVDGYDEGRKNVVPIGSNSTSGTGWLGSMYTTRINSQLVNQDLMLNFDHKFNEDLHFHMLVGGNMFYQKYDNLTNYGTSFVLPDLYDITNTQTQTIQHGFTQKKTYGVYGDATLDYKEFLFLDVTLRNDWTSTLPRANNSFIYPGVSLGFVFSDLLKADWLSYGKLRGSFAQTAAGTDPYNTSTTYENVTPNVSGAVRFSYPTTAGNPNLRPEQTKQWEIGADLGFFKRKLFLEATYYNKNSFDNIIYAPTSYATGITTQVANLGQITNQGFDITLTFKDLINAKGFGWTSAFNFTRNTSNVVKVGINGTDKVTLVNAYNSTAEIDAAKGQKFGAIYGYAWKRYGVEETDPNYLKAPILLDADGNPTQSDGKVLLGNTSPDFILGWNNTFTYANFNFGFTIEWRKGGDVINDYNNIMTYSGNSWTTQNRWYNATEPGANTTKTWVGVDETGKSVSVPINLTKTYYTTNFVNTDENWVEDASWFRLRNIYLGYSLPARILKPLHLQGVDLTISGRNVWLSTKYTGIDPEVSSQGSGRNGAVGLDAAGIPATKSWDFAIKIRF